MAIDEELLTVLCRAVRSRSQDTRDEVAELTEACIIDLEIAGVHIADDTDPLFIQAAKLYCKAHYGYDAEMDVKKFRDGYEHLKIAMALSGDYAKEGE